jgi:hypothetical protein
MFGLWFKTWLSKPTKMEHGLVVMTNPKEPLCMVNQQETGFTLKVYGLRKTAYGHGHGLIAVGMTLVVVIGEQLL